MKELLKILISDYLIEKILELSDKYDNEYFVDHFSLNERVEYIKEHLCEIK